MHLPSISMPNISDSIRKFAASDTTALEKTEPAALNEAENRSVRGSVRAAFPEAWQVSLLGLDTGRTSNGDLVSCGAYNAVSADRANTRSGVFRTETERGTGRTRLVEISGSGSTRLTVFSNCQMLGLF